MFLIDLIKVDKSYWVLLNVIEIEFGEIEFSRNRSKLVCLWINLHWRSGDCSLKEMPLESSLPPAARYSLQYNELDYDLLKLEQMNGICKACWWFHFSFSKSSSCGDYRCQLHSRMRIKISYRNIDNYLEARESVSPTLKS